MVLLKSQVNPKDKMRGKEMRNFNRIEIPEMSDLRCVSFFSIVLLRWPNQSQKTEFDWDFDANKNSFDQGLLSLRFIQDNNLN